MQSANGRELGEILFCGRGGEDGAVESKACDVWTEWYVGGMIIGIFIFHYLKSEMAKRWNVVKVAE